MTRVLRCAAVPVGSGYRPMRAEMLFGLFVVSGLLITLVVSPYGWVTPWPLTPWTITMAVLGHLPETTHPIRGTRAAGVPA